MENCLFPLGIIALLQLLIGTIAGAEHESFVKYLIIKELNLWL
jgi:hypothetical protein